jgi:tetratricopeptide (TPR) repeat protein
VRPLDSASVTAERWQQIKRIVAEALEQNSPEARHAIVAGQCAGDPELLREVESLLDQTTGALENFAEKAAAPLRQDRSGLEAGRRMGVWAILRELGRGGMGAVYLAERADGAFEKQVAIKVLKRGTDTDEILRRFEAERQILARLDHPNITRLVDAGTTDDGLPYVVMDYVVGKPITQYAAENELSVAERLELFRAVCGAVSYAHQNLVVHRDLKPSNILVTENSKVQLLDFGIAKLLSDAEGSGAEMTVTALRVMTPEYASPEQIKGEPITTLSDVYSLGVCLYELLTGIRPYKLPRKTPDELSKAICEQEPERPSTTAARRAENSKLQIRNAKALSGDLDNIVLMALRKEPARRYASVEQFSEDIRRYLRGLPVRAHKATYAYRASKFVARNKLGLAAALLLVLTLSGGIIATSIQARNARRRFNQVRKLAHSVLFDYHDAIATLPGATKVREQLVKDGLAYLDNLSKEAGSDRSLLRELASAYEKVAAVQGGIAVSSQGTTLSSSNLGDIVGARASLRKAVQLRDRVNNLEPNNLEIRYELGLCHDLLAETYLVGGPPEKTIEHETQANSIFESCLAADPENEKVLYAMSASYIGLAKAFGSPAVANLGDTKKALEHLNKSLALIEKLVAKHPDNLIYQIILGASYNLQTALWGAAGNEKEALEASRKAVAIDQRVVELDPKNTRPRNELAIQLGNVGSSMLKLNDPAGALENFRQALALYESLSTADPSDALVRRNLAVGYRNVATAMGKTGNRPGAVENFQKALHIFGEMSGRDSTNADLRRQLALTCLYLSRFQVEINELNDALASALEGIKVEEKLVADFPTNASARNTLAQLDAHLGKTDSALAAAASGPDPRANEEWRSAKAAYQKALALYLEMKTKGTLLASDAKKPDELAVEIARCDAALK